jgi:hypothetical protein
MYYTNVIQHVDILTIRALDPFLASTRSSCSHLSGPAC